MVAVMSLYCYLAVDRRALKDGVQPTAAQQFCCDVPAQSTH